MKRTERLRAGMSPNGKRVHLARFDGTPVCGADVFANNWVHARITCSACAKARPAKAARLAGRPLVVGLNWEPFYRAMERAVDGFYEQAQRGELDPKDIRQPKINVPYWPVLG